MLVFHSPPLTHSKYFKKIYFNFKAWLWGPPLCEVWYCLPPDCCLSNALEDLLKPHWGKPREKKKAPEKQEVFTCSRNTRQNKTKKNPFSLSALVTSSPRTNRLLSPLLLSLFFFFFLLFLLFFILVCAEARDWHQMSSSMAHLFLEAESRWTWRLLTSDSPGDACAPSIFCLCILSSGIAGWPCYLSGYHVSLKHPQAGRANYFSPRPSADSAREQGKRLHVTVDGLLWEKPGYKRCSLEEVTTVFIWLTIAPSGNETFGKGHTALIPWLAGR